MFPVVPDDPFADPEVVLTPVVGEMLQLVTVIFDPVSVKLVEPPVAMLPPPLLATERPVGVGQFGTVPTVTVAVAFAAVVVQAPPVEYPV